MLKEFNMIYNGKPSIIQVFVTHKTKPFIEYKTTMVFKNNQKEVVGEFKLSGVGKHVYEKQPEITIHIDEKIRGHKMTKPLIYLSMEYVKKKDTNISKLNPWIFIDADGSGTIDGEKTFWDHVGFRYNPYYEKEESDEATKTKSRGSRSRSKIHIDKYDKYGYGYEKRVRFNTLYNYGKPVEHTKTRKKRKHIRIQSYTQSMSRSKSREDDTPKRRRSSRIKIRRGE